MIDNAARRELTRRMIYTDRWHVVVHHRTDSGDTDLRFDAKVAPAGVRGVPLLSGGQMGERPPERQVWVILAAWDVPVFTPGDPITATHHETGVVHEFETIAINKYPYKTEVMVNELQ